MIKTTIDKVQTKENISSENRQSLFSYLTKCKRESIARRAEMLLNGQKEDVPSIFETLNSGKLGKLIRYIRNSGLLAVIWGGYLAQRAFS